MRDPSIDAATDDWPADVAASTRAHSENCLCAGDHCVLDESGVCYGCEHCGCDPDDPDDYCQVCDDCPSDIDDREDDWL